MNNYSLSESILQKTISQGAKEVEVYLIEKDTLKISVLNQEIEAIDNLSETGLALRAIKDQKMGFSYTTDLSDYGLQQSIENALAALNENAPDQFNQLPEKNPTTTKESDLLIYDEEIQKISRDEKIKLALEIEKRAYQEDTLIKKTEKVVYQDSLKKVFILNSKGVKASYQKSIVGGFAEVLAVTENENEGGDEAFFFTHFKDFDPQLIGKNAAQKALRALNAQSIPSQKIPLILSPEVGADLLSVLASTLTASAVQKHKSLFREKMEKMVASENITIIDNGLMPKGLSSSPVDLEGVPRQETLLIEDGRLKGLLYHTYTALKDGRRSSGNASRLSFKSLPTIAPSNLYFKPQTKSPEEIIKSLSKGVYITGVMGLHTANPISGDFSVGATGIMIENGEKTFSIKGITIAGNLIEMLTSIIEIGNDLRFFSGDGNIGSPTLLIEGISLSGR